MSKVIAEDFTLITHNSKDLCETPDAPDKGLHVRESLHAGLVCLNAFHAMDLDRQAKLLRMALDELSQFPDLLNQALEITENEDGSIDVDRYSIP